MNEQELKTYCLEHAGEALPPEARALLERDPALRAEVDRLARVAALMGLKRYETPHPSALPRCVQAVEARIAAGEGETMWERLAAAWTPAAWAGAAALLAVTALGVTVMTGGREGSPSLTTIEAEVVAPVVIEPVQLTREADPAEALAESPALLIPREGMRVTCAVGGQERPEFIRQNDLLANVWQGLGADMEALHLPGVHHFDVIDALADPDGVLTRCLLDQSRA